MEPGVRLFLHDEENGGVFGDGKWRLLREIQRRGSISKAAEILGRGYRKAWEDINKTERILGRKLVKRTRGGARGGSTELTEYGNRLLEEWARYRRQVRSCMRRAYSRHLREIMKRSQP